MCVHACTSLAISEIRHYLICSCICLVNIRRWTFYITCNTNSTHLTYCFFSAAGNASCNFDDIDICGYEDRSPSSVKWTQIHNESESIFVIRNSVDRYFTLRSPLTGDNTTTSSFFIHCRQSLNHQDGNEICSP